MTFQVALPSSKTSLAHRHLPLLLSKSASKDLIPCRNSCDLNFHAQEKALSAGMRFKHAIPAPIDYCKDQSQALMVS